MTSFTGAVRHWPGKFEFADGGDAEFITGAAVYPRRAPRMSNRSVASPSADRESDEIDVRPPEMIRSS